MGDDITIGVTEIVNNIEVTAQPNDQIIDISVTDNSDEVTLNITPTVVEVNINKGGSFAQWGNISGTLSDQTDLQSALNAKANLVGGKVPASELPSYVDDIIEVANYAALPATGETGKIYVTIDNNKIYRWTGSTYVEITDNTAVWGAITGTLSSQTDLVTALNLRVPYTGATGDVNLGTYDIKAQKYWMLDEVNSNYGSMHFTDGNYHIEDADGHKLFVIEDGFMQLHKTDTIQSNLYTSNLTAVRDHYLPDASGTLALDENVVHKTGDETISGRKTFNSTTDIGIRSNISGNGYGIYSENSSNGISFYVANNGSGKAFSVSNTLGSFGNMYEGSYNGTSNFAVNYLGEITASKFIKSGGTAFEFLKANGDVDSNIYFKGSVTAGYIPKSLYPSSGDFTTSLIYDSGTNIGIGTTSPVYKFHVNDTSDGIVGHFSGGVSNYTLISFKSNEANVYSTSLGSYNSGLLFRTGATDRMYINSSGNVGIGTTSPAGIWSGSHKALQITGGTNIASELVQSRPSATITRFLSGTAAEFGVYTADALNYTIYTSGSERMRITSSGNVGIGTTNPSEKLTLTNGKLFLTEADPTIGGKIYGYNDTSTDLYGGGLKFQSRYYDGANYVYADRLTIKGNGNVGIGTTSPSSKLSLYDTSDLWINISRGSNFLNLGLDSTGVFYNTNTNHRFLYNSGANEAMRITSGGDVLVGTTTNTYVSRLVLNGNGANNTLECVHTGTANTYNVIFSNGNGAVGSITTNGSLTSYNITSDYRLKQDFKSFNGLDLVSKIKVYDYQWKVDNSRMNGVIAHELQEVVPYAVTGEKDAEQMQQVDYSKLVPILVQAIQELQDKINKLENK